MKRVIPLFAVMIAYGVAHGEPRLASERRTVGDFHGIELAGVLDVEVALGKPVSVEISGEADQIGQVSTSVKDGVLVIATKPKMIGNSHLRAIVTAPDLTSLALSGVGDLKVTGVANENLAINASGVGSLTAAGTTASLHVIASGTGDVSARGLVARSATVVASGVGNTALQATQSIDATLSGVGDIDVYGRPQQIKRRSRNAIGEIHIR